MKNFEIGQKVFSSVYGAGKISDITNCNWYPIKVSFKEKRISFSLTGREYNSDKYRVLFHSTEEAIAYAKENFVNESERIISLFKTYFDGGYEIDAQPNVSNTYAMGVCKLEYDDINNVLEVYLRKPGLLIGEKGKIINDLEKYLDCKLEVIEHNPFDIK